MIAKFDAVVCLGDEETMIALINGPDIPSTLGRMSDELDAVTRTALDAEECTISYVLEGPQTIALLVQPPLLVVSVVYLVAGDGLSISLIQVHRIPSLSVNENVGSS